MKEKLSAIAVLGAGSWGTALAVHLASHGNVVYLWDNDSAHIKQLQSDRLNQRYLPNIRLPDNIVPHADLAEIVSFTRDILVVVPSQYFRPVLTQLQPIIPSDTRIMWATKGIDPQTNHLFHRVVEERLGRRSMAALSGPSFAVEVANRMPTTVVVATNDLFFGQEIVKKFNQGMFRVYLSSDLVGVQVGGAVKNVIAIAAGLSDGLGFGSNAKSGLITRGLAEMMRLGIALGAKPETFMGLSGLGDLVLTCTDNQSRNRRFGLALAQGKDQRAIEQAIGQVVEGVHTVKQVIALAEHYQVDMPISRQVYRILMGEVLPQQAVMELLSRKPKSE